LFLAPAAFGSIIKRNACISGADVGCRAEGGSAVPTAAAGSAAAPRGGNHPIETDKRNQMRVARSILHLVQ
jgi:L-serine dehydratase